MTRWWCKRINGSHRMSVLRRWRVWINLTLITIILSFVASAKLFQGKCQSIEPGMNKKQITTILGDPLEKMEIIGDGREVWLYSPFPLENCFKRKTQRLLRLEDAPYVYCRYTYIFDKSSNVEAWTFQGEDDRIRTRDGNIRGDSIHAYCDHERARAGVTPQAK